ncbi:MAG: hypothetical protein K8R69_00800 [Deltaproteobacteria bacterium]|nr:hypothetical protein [Deltaproteobacteria bacterium]
MSDIGLPPGIAIFLVSMGLAALTLLLALGFLLTGLLSQKSLAFSSRRATCLWFGMAIPIAFSGLGLLAASYAPHEWLAASERIHPAWLFSTALLTLAIGVAWGARRYRKLHNTTS